MSSSYMSVGDEEDEQCIHDELSEKIQDLLPDVEITLEELKRIPFRYVMHDARVRMAEFLQPPEGKCWKSLAHAIGIRPEAIQAIGHTYNPQHSGLHAIQIFEEFEKNEGSIGQMLFLLATLDRRDVIHQLIGFIPSILRYYETCTKKSQPWKKVLAEPEMSLSSQHIGKRPRRKIRLYISYCKNFVQEALNMYSWLEKEKFAIALDDHQSFDPITVQKRFDRVKYVLVCVTPDYYLEILKSSSSASLANPQTPTHLIYRLMLNSFQNSNGCNTRFIPLCCKGASNKHIPPFLIEKNGSPSKIRIFNYPEELNNLLYFLKDPINVVDQHIKKKLEEEEEESGVDRKVKTEK